MKDCDFLIFGGGPAGLGALQCLGERALLLEKTEVLGGLCSSFSKNGFLFDHCVHLSFTQNPIVLSYLKAVPFYSHKPFALNYYKSQWLVHPVQDNLYPLSIKEKESLIAGFKDRPLIEHPNNYYEWLLTSFGKPFTDSFSAVYTLKYWCVKPESLSTDWCGGRIYRPSLDEVVYGSTHAATPNVYYAKEMHYPKTGGYASFFARTDFLKQVSLNKSVIKINLLKHIVTCQDGSVFHWRLGCLSSLPLPLIPLLISDCPSAVSSAAKRLRFTSAANVSIAFNKKVNVPSLWFYIYDLNIPFARAYSPSLKSSANAPEGCSSIQLEHYYLGQDSLTDEELLLAARTFLKKSKIAEGNEIAFMTVSRLTYANVVFYLGMEKDRQIVLDYLKAQDLVPIGRFGLWDYLWSDQAFISGYNAAEKMISPKSGLFF
jgi:protoporphyrinogen oxidase